MTVALNEELSKALGLAQRSIELAAGIELALPGAGAAERLWRAD